MSSIGYSPTSSKKAIIRPTFKGGDESGVIHYKITGSIALLPAFSKILEKIVNCGLVSYPKTNVNSAKGKSAIIL